MEHSWITVRNKTHMKGEEEEEEEKKAGTSRIKVQDNPWERQILLLQGEFHEKVQEYCDPFSRPV